MLYKKKRAGYEPEDLFYIFAINDFRYIFDDACFIVRGWPICRKHKELRSVDIFRLSFMVPLLHFTFLTVCDDSVTLQVLKGRLRPSFSPILMDTSLFLCNMKKNKDWVLSLLSFAKNRTSLSIILCILLIFEAEKS